MRTGLLFPLPGSLSEPQGGQCPRRIHYQADRKHWCDEGRGESQGESIHKRCRERRRRREEEEGEGPLESERRSSRSVKIAKKPKTVLKKPKLVPEKKPTAVKKSKPRVKHRASQSEEAVPQCPPLGLESLMVKDHQLSASSSRRRGLGPHRGRLNIQSGIEDGDIYDGGWCSRLRDRSQWLQVDALKLTRFTGVVLQGRASIWSWNLVYSYKVQFSNDTLVWRPAANGTREANKKS
ncbi:hypothetical protein CgunFtcFv8_017176 [Champsocephalus gunnari]|uniref:F5/8 type C domain-containing protein n=1 Tax=Champsocephalus gunnari TaxID=52237 RepID=A0AAN8DPQ4_CHAGU|nr:hypothetical protein CgunFtcFv8_017176 [Champsocephalus gunnari]